VLAVRIWHVTNVVCIFTEAACLKVWARTSFKPLTWYANYLPLPGRIWCLWPNVSLWPHQVNFLS
jgi:hypothetical protein